VDIGSRVDGFVAHVASFREIEVFDIRPITTKVPGATFIQADLMNPVAHELQRVLINGGNLLLAVPVGRSMLMSNAHSIYSYDQVLVCFPRCTCANSR